MQIGLLYNSSFDGSKSVAEYLKENLFHYVNFRDVYDSALFEKFDLNADGILFDRNNIFCTPVPYVNDWVEKANSGSEKAEENKDVDKSDLIGKYLRTHFSSKYAPKGYQEVFFDSGPFCLTKVN